SRYSDSAASSLRASSGVLVVLNFVWMADAIDVLLFNGDLLVCCGCSDVDFFPKENPSLISPPAISIGLGASSLLQRIAGNKEHKGLQGRGRKGKGCGGSGGGMGVRCGGSGGPKREGVGWGWGKSGEAWLAVVNWRQR
ncbi:hypothetical protein Ancab_036193, partial [Ancistrocladus abbreviatus]